VNRSYILRIPKNYDSGKPAPLLMAFHGGGNSAELMESARQDLIDAGEEMGFIVVFAQGYTSSNSLTKASWNAAHCCGVSYRDQIDDIAYTREVVASLSASLSVNPDLVFATGFSNGGMMTHRVAAELSDVFAAAIPIAGSIGGQYTEGYPHSKLNETSGPISVLMINGRKDASIKYDGGKSDKSKGGRLDVSAPDGIRFWASEMGCSSTPQILNVADGVTFESFPNCDGGVQVALATVDEMAHAWPMKERVGMDGTWALFQFLSRVSGTRSR
jgi:polyhydroxybutyrate depolymerase